MLAHELSHVAHRDVLVMTVASSAGIVAGMLTRGAQFGALRPGPQPQQQQRRCRPTSSRWLVSLVVYAISFFLTRLLSRYRELCADRSGAYLTMKPRRWPRRCRRSPARWRRSRSATCARRSAMNAFFIAPAISGASLRDPDRRPTRRWSSGSSSSPGSRPSSAGRRAERRDGSLGRDDRPERGSSGANLDALFLVPSAAITLETAAGLTPDRRRVGLLPGGGRARRSHQTQADIVALIERRPAGARRSR